MQLATLISMQHAQCMLQFLVLAVIPTGFKFYGVTQATCSYALWRGYS